MKKPTVVPFKKFRWRRIEARLTFFPSAPPDGSSKKNIRLLADELIRNGDRPFHFPRESAKAIEKK